MPTPRTLKPPLSEATGALGARVRAERDRLRLTQESLAEKTSLHWSYIGQVERGQVNLTLHSLLRIADVLGVDAGALVTGLPVPDTN